ncbi:MAG: lysylphosphatidylglycerol synthase domain-containing protein [Smithella sp.]
MDFFSKSNNNKIYSRILFIIVLAFVLFYIIRSFQDLSSYIQQINYTSLFLSFFFTLIAYLLSLFIWIDIAAAFGLKASFMSAARAWSLSQLGKYIPGKAGLILVRLDAYESYPRRTVAVATVVEFLAAFIASCLLILFSMFFMKNMIPEYLRITAALLSLFLLVLLHPKLLKYLTNILLTFFKRDPIEDFPSFGLILKFVFINLLIGIPYGLGMFYSMDCFADLSFNYLIPMTGIYYAASLAGIAALFAPAGLGVREGIIFLILPAFIAKGVVIAGTIMIRIVSIVVEICLALFFYFYPYKNNT